jgi:AcrR family transcriptional regulator
MNELAHNTDFLRRTMDHKETGAGNRRLIQKEETRKHILATARDLFNDAGFDKTSTRAVAARAGVGVGTVFSHFPDKSSLLIAALLDDLGTTQADAMKTLPKEGSVCERFLHLARHFYTYYAKRPDLSRTLLKEFWFVKGEWGEKLTAQAYAFVFLVGEMLELAKNRGELRPEADVLMCARAFFSHYLIVLYEGLNQPQVDVQTMLNTLKGMLDQLLAGIGQTQ